MSRNRNHMSNGYADDDPVWPQLKRGLTVTALIIGAVLGLGWLIHAYEIAFGLILLSIFGIGVTLTLLFLVLGMMYGEYRAREIYSAVLQGIVDWIRAKGKVSTPASTQKGDLQSVKDSMKG